MFIDTTLETAETANLSLAAQPLAARLALPVASVWAPASGPGRLELLASAVVLGLTLLLLTSTIAEALTL